jgi:hypothetical protein
MLHHPGEGTLAQQLRETVGKRIWEDYGVQWARSTLEEMGYRSKVTVSILRRLKLDGKRASLYNPTQRLLRPEIIIIPSDVLHVHPGCSGAENPEGKTPPKQQK